LSVVRPAVAGEPGAFETFIKITADGSVTAFNGHVDLGTGIRTALGQIVAEELDVSFARVVVVLGDTSQVPNQGATIASETIQITAIPLRNAAAQARHFLIARAAERLELSVEDLTIEDGLVRGRDNRSVSYGELITGETIRLELAGNVEVKPVGAYTIVGQSVPRADLPAKATGELVYVHDLRVPGMLHGRVVRPPYAGVDAGPFVGTSLIAIDEASVRDIPGLVAVVRIGDFVGIVAEREEKRGQGGGAAKSNVETDPDTARSEGRRAGAARQSIDAAHPDRQRRRRHGHRRRRNADAADLYLALPDARFDRPVLRRRGLPGRQHQGLVRHAKSSHASDRSCAAVGKT
jgi:nicotinate dehydrogenase subunit B